MKNTRITDQSSPTAREAEEADGGSQKRRERAIDVNVAQVAGSALAAVIAALIAGRLGVYGTFIGAGVISVVATTGGPVFQHLLRRTGQEVKEQVKQQVKIPPTRPLSAGATRRTDDPADATVAMPAVDDGSADRTQLLDTRHLSASTHAASTGQQEQAVGEFTEPRTEGTKWRGWRRMLLPAVLVFVVAMGGITLYEMLSGNNVSGGHGGTTSIGQVFGRESVDESPASPDDDQDEGENSPGTAPTDGSVDEAPGGDDDTNESSTSGGGQQDPSTEVPQEGSGTDSGGTSAGTSAGEGESTRPTPTPFPDQGSNGVDGGAQTGGTSTGGQEGSEGGDGVSGGVERAPQRQPAPDAE